MKLNANQEEFKETTRKLESKIEALEKQLKEKLDSQKILTVNLGTKLDGEVLKLKEESQPFVWKIEGCKQFLKAAKRGIEMNLYSSYFFTGPNGYKLELCMCPHVKNTHISVYLYILRGKYDAILPWPFRKTVTFTLIDQQENAMHRQNYVKILCCDGGSDFLARPVTDFNSGYGFPKFISHEDTLLTTHFFSKYRLVPHPSVSQSLNRWACSFDSCHVN